MNKEKFWDKLRNIVGKEDAGRKTVRQDVKNLKKKIKDEV